MTSQRQSVFLVLASNDGGAPHPALRRAVAACPRAVLVSADLSAGPGVVLLGEAESRPGRFSWTEEPETVERAHEPARLAYVVHRIAGAVAAGKAG